MPAKDLSDLPAFHQDATNREWIENAVWLKEITEKPVSNISFGDISKLSELKNELQLLWEFTTELNHWNLISTAIDHTYPSNKKLTQFDSDSPRMVPHNPSIYKELKYCMSYAAYSYFMPLIGPPHDIIIQERDLPLTAKIHGTKVADPGYLIGLDHENKYILLTIRGTSTPGDVITDLDGVPMVQSFGDEAKFYVHPGIYDSTVRLHDEVIGTMERCANSYPTYKILVTGHSLGAGVCSLLGLLWNTNHVFDKERFQCYSFASPLVVDEDGMKLSLTFKNMVSVATATDIVTRTGGKSILALIERVKIIRSYADSDALVNNIIKARVSSSSKSEFEGKLGNREKTFIKELKRAEGGRFGRGLKALYPCGELLWFMPQFDAKEPKRYEKLIHKVIDDCRGSFWIQVLRLIPQIVKDFYVVNNNEILQPINASLTDRFELTQMVYHGYESFHAHFPGRYTNGFNIDIVDIFMMSQLYYLISIVMWPIMWIPGVQKLLALAIQLFMIPPVLFFVLTQVIWNASNYYIYLKAFYFYAFVFKHVASVIKSKR
eukprot:249788_1